MAVNLVNLSPDSGEAVNESAWNNGEESIGR